MPILRNSPRASDGLSAGEKTIRAKMESTANYGIRNWLRNLHLRARESRGEGGIGPITGRVLRSVRRFRGEAGRDSTPAAARRRAGQRLRRLARRTGNWRRPAGSRPTRARGLPDPRLSAISSAASQRPVNSGFLRAKKAETPSRKSGVAAQATKESCSSASCSINVRCPACRSRRRARP